MLIREADINCHDLTNIQFTSGTTGHPKGATLTHHNILNNSLFVGEGLGYTDQDRICIPGPLYHCLGMVLGNLCSLNFGSTIVMPGSSYDPQNLLQTLHDERITSLLAVPTVYVSLCKLVQERKNEFDLSPLRTGIMAGSACTEPIIRKSVDLLGVHGLSVLYGQTETSPVSIMNKHDGPFEKKLYYCGSPLPGVEMKLVDKEGETVPVGVEGEVCCRGYLVMHGYYNDEEKTRETIDEQGWLHSGDLGVMDEEGYFKITGRVKDMIIRGGENVYPKEIEDFYGMHEKVVDVQVIAVEDELMGEEVCAWFQMDINSEGDLSEQ